MFRQCFFVRILVKRKMKRGRVGKIRRTMCIFLNRKH